MSKKKITVKVCGNEFNILSEDSVEYTQKVASAVDKKMRMILEASPYASITKVAILAALDFCDLSKKMTEQGDSMRTQIREYLEDSQKAREEADDARKETERLKAEIETLRQRLAEKDAKKQRETQEPISAPVRKSSRRGRRAVTSEEHDEAAEEILSFFADNGDNNGDKT